MHTTPSIFGKVYNARLEVCGGLIEEHSKLVIDGQTQFGMPRGAKINLALNEP